MIKKTKLIIACAFACLGCGILGACAGSDPYERLGGYRVRFEANGGVFAGTPDTTLVDVYATENVEKGVKLIEPGSSVRGSGRESSTVSRENYFCVGWYRNKELRTDENGNALDAYGELCSVSGLEQSYVYSGRWNFNSDVFGLEDVTEGDYNFVLYAAWIPVFSYEIYDDSEELVGEVTFNPLTSSGELALPDYSEDTGAMVYGNFPESSGKTFEALYSDAAMSEEWTEDTVVHSGTLDYETGVAENIVNKFYARYKDGVWFKISTAKQFISNSRADGCYEILADLDFENLGWALATASFSGRIIGNNHTFSNITVMQSNYNQTNGGLFGKIDSTAVFTDVSFENIVYTLNAASRMNGASFGTFAGAIASEAAFENVSVQGTLQIGNVFYSETTGYPYDVGLLSGNLETGGIDYEIGCEIIAVQNGTSITYPHAVTVKKSTGEVILSANENETVCPEVQYID